MKNFDNIDQLVAFLTETLIPDLRDSGSNGTADDFEDCIEAIESLQPDTPKDRIHEIEWLQVIWVETAFGPSGGYWPTATDETGHHQQRNAT